MSTDKVLLDILHERRRQDTLFPNQSLPDGTSEDESSLVLRDTCQQATDARSKDGTVTWRDVLREEVYEAFAEVDPAKLRAELVQVAAVAARWVEDIDRRAA